MSACICCEGDRCLQCATVCENCVASCPTAPMWPSAWPTAATRSSTWTRCATSAATAPSSAQLRALPRQVHPVPDRRGHGGQPQCRCPVPGRRQGPRSVPSASRRTMTCPANDLPVDLEKLIVTLRDKYSYLYLYAYPPRCQPGNAKSNRPPRFFCGCLPPGGGFKRRGTKPTSAYMQGFPLNTRRGRRPRRPQKRHPVGVPFCYSSSKGAKLSLAIRPEII